MPAAGSARSGDAEPPMRRGRGRAVLRPVPISIGIAQSAAVRARDLQESEIVTAAAGAVRRDRAATRPLRIPVRRSRPAGQAGSYDFTGREFYRSVLIAGRAKRLFATRRRGRATILVRYFPQERSAAEPPCTVAGPSLDRRG